MGAEVAETMSSRAEEEEEDGGGAWTVLARVDASRPASSSDAGDGETERGRGRTLKLALVRGESEETREMATVVEREQIGRAHV